MCMHPTTRQTMPKRKYSGKGRNGRKRRRKLPLLRSPIPKSTIAKLRYAAVEDRVFGAIIAQDDYVFCANDCFDPDYTGSGHQPRGFDQYMSMFDHFTVVGSKITVTATNTSSTVASTPIVVGLALTDNNASITTAWEDMMERSDIMTRTLAHPEGSKASATVWNKFSAKKFFTRGDVMDDPNLKGTAGASPYERAWYHIVLATPTIVADRTVNLNVLIDYIVVFSEPKLPASS